MTQPDLKRPNFHSKASIPLDAKVVQLGYSMEVLLESASWPPKKVEVAMETWQASNFLGVSWRPRIMDFSCLLVGVSHQPIFQRIFVFVYCSRIGSFKPSWGKNRTSWNRPPRKLYQFWVLNFSQKIKSTFWDMGSAVGFLPVILWMMFAWWSGFF